MQKRRTKIVDLTDYSMPSFLGYQSYSKAQAESVLRRVPPKIRKGYKVEKDEPPFWIVRSGGSWRQTYSIQKK